MNPPNWKAGGKRIWIWSLTITLVVCVNPIENQMTRIGLVVGGMICWVGALFLGWSKWYVRYGVLGMGVVLLLGIGLPGRPVDPGRLASDYSKVLRFYTGVRYVWGGEGFLGVDCSGLVRKGLVWGQLFHGLRTLNGRSIRDALELWWYDCSAKALGAGYREWTVELFRSDSVISGDWSRLRPGDLAVTEDGVHVMAFLGEQRWIEADPDAKRVLEFIFVGRFIR